ncbi:MAG: DUF2550 domain-containing protein [Corynebacterium sp.]|nr:DUF2550 domain-containing protein [Corynebacterium sp.]
MMILVVIICLILAVLILLGAWRFFVIRRAGTPVRIRHLPKPDFRGWRHGVMIYRGDEIHFYQVRSLSPFPDRCFLRNKVSHEGRRTATPEEIARIGDGLAIITVHQSGQEFEFALDNQAELAFTAWIESAPSDQLRRTVRRFMERY